MEFIQDFIQRFRDTGLEKISLSQLTDQLRGFLRQPRLVTLQTRLTVPYIVLTILLAMIGTYIITRLVTSSVGERFDNQLLEASRITADGIVQRERVHLANLRQMAFTEGVAEAIAGGEVDKARDLLWPLVLNNRIEALAIIDRDGKEMLTLVLDPQTNEYLSSRGKDFSGIPLVRNILQRQSDNLGDKYADLLSTTLGPLLFTSAPVRDSGDQLVGVLLVGSRLETLLAGLKTQALADIAVLDSSGQAVATTLASPPEGYGVLELSADQLDRVSPTLAQDFKLYSRDFKGVYAPLVIRQQTIGVLLALLPSDYVFATGATSRNWFIVIFTLGTLGIIGVGYWLAREIARPILRLRSVSQAVAAGDLEQKTGLRRGDELGDLAKAFDTMTIRLRQRTAEAAQLYAETLERNRQLAEINAKLQAAQNQLVQSEKLAAIGQLTAGIIHDVKNPLAVVIGILEELNEDKKLSREEIVSHLKTVRDSAWRANTIITDLLKFARQSTPEMKRQDIRNTVESALRLTEFLARKGKVQVIKDVPLTSVVVTYDAVQIEQVLINLIQNAIQAMPDGGQLRTVLSRAKDAVAIAIQDTGVGIPPQNLMRVFDPFFTTKPSSQGTGLGLSVSYGIVSRHGGRIDVASEVGKGATFTMLLPIQPPPQPKEKKL